MRGYVGNTHQDWFEFLRDRPGLDEVNFWQPSGSRNFRVVTPGSPFFFRLKSPYRAIGGFGIFVGFSILPTWLAWESFGEKNGAQSFEELVSRISALRRNKELDRSGSMEIGCIMIRGPVFFSREDWVRDVSGWADQTVQGKSLALTEGEGLRIYTECQERLSPYIPSEVLQVHEEMPDARAARFGKESIVLPRLGQGTFRALVTDAYSRSCAVTTEHSLPVLEAAHIKSYRSGGEHRISNGLLLRADIHRLFDKGYVTVTDKLRFEVSRKLREDWENGRIYYDMHGRELRCPTSDQLAPDRSMLNWHAENVFRG